MYTLEQTDSTNWSLKPVARCICAFNITTTRQHNNSSSTNRSQSQYRDEK